MAATRDDEFFFDKTDLFNKVKRIEQIIGLGDLGIGDISTELEALRQTVELINSSFTTKTYVDNKLLTKVNKAGDTILGNLELLIAPDGNKHLVTKEYVDALITEINSLNIEIDTLASTAYVDAQVANRVDKFGDILYGELILANDATNPLHPISKQQFDSTLDRVALTGTLDW